MIELVYGPAKKVVVTPTIFPDKTSQVWKLNPEHFKESFVQITWTFENEGELMHVAQLKSLLDSEGCETRLTLPYLPYGRQDKEVSNEATFALRTFASIINSLGFSEVVITDPHSEIALDLIVHSSAVYPRKQVEEIAQFLDVDGGLTIFCFPDKGALTKYSKVYEHSHRPFVWGEKVRDQATGNILSYQLVGDVADCNVLIVDDICDGGMTFKLLARDLLAAGAKSVVLFVTHGIFSKGVQTLRDSGISAVYDKTGLKVN